MKSGRYEMTVGADGKMDLALTPDAVVPPEPPPPPAVPILGLGRWRSRMVEFGHKFGAPNPEMNTWEGYVWYYDGFRIFQRIAEYTGDDSWLVEAAQCERVYLENYLRKLGTTGWRVFPHGSEMAYRRTGDVKYLGDLLLLANKSPYGAHSADRIKTTLAKYTRSREAAYLLQTLLAWKRLSARGYPTAALKDYIKMVAGSTELKNIGPDRPTELDERIGVLAGLVHCHFDQWFANKSADSMQPFMAALSAHALIEFADFCGGGSPGYFAVRESLKRAADWLRDNAWIEDDGGFYYQSQHPYDADGDTELRGAPVLNMLIAPMYAWLYKETGDAGWRDFGDKVFEAGTAAVLHSGKEFSQQYRWSFEYVAWRQGGK